jgi:hypothetical protein
MKRGEEPDWKLEYLPERYRGIWRVHEGMADRLSPALALDANMNAVIVLSACGSVPVDCLE